MRHDVSVVILAAGLGTRMKSRYAKVLHKAGGKTLLQHVIDTALSLAPPERIFAVIGHQAEQVRQSAARSGIGFIEQTEQKAATPEQLAIREANMGIYCFRADLFWKHVDEIQPNNPAREYYLTDMPA